MSPQHIIPAAMLALATFAPFHASAADTNANPGANPGPVYAGASYGFRASTGLDCAPGQQNCDKSSKRNGKAYVGYSFDALPFQGGVAVPAIELVGYTSGSVTSGFDTGAGKVAGRGKFNGAGVQGVLGYQFDAFTLSGRAGLAYTQGKVDYATGGSDKENKAGLMYGLGAAYALNKNWSLHLDWDRVPVKYSGSQKTKADMFSLGASYRF
ncbi:MULTISPECIES: outer membrane protein [unclassified Janthinobacterium]|uniref:outer membrane protein n=1 Tax=unclassified Janthinobacterium TaxID=2610881 RepID=UPI00161D5012|nr:MULTISPECIES: outer membrane beta-barrel protein [unclassified Janthinobacterium]MBB5370317.1 opacity protein-like surface antigen [Janthinobacterium sp. K2C7]MBB5383123.1 opacity protein-like surface antigen [Janthinobacterium sp. K2Li3]MBB5388398.1 opacity protein-like surface antigen [Janthinobacterium sp. K2E3]